MAEVSSLVESSSPSSHNKSCFMEATSSSPPTFSPSSDRRYWSALRSRVENNRKSIDSSQTKNGEVAAEASKGMKEDTALLLRGFDSMSQSLSHLSKTLKTAVQGAVDLAGSSPILSETFHANQDKDKAAEGSEDDNVEQAEEEHSQEERDKKVKKRKLEEEHNTQTGQGKMSPNELAKMKESRNLAISMAKKAVAMGRELKSIRSDLSYMQERCALLEEENKKLRGGDGIGEEEEDDLVRLQLEALLAEKSRLANENANLKRENQCLHQLVEYHQLTSQDLSASYDNLVRGMCLDLEYSSPPLPLHDEVTAVNGGNNNKSEFMEFSKSLEDCFDGEE